MRKWTILFWLLAFGGVIFSFNIGGYDLWPADEPRFAEVAREMVVSNNYLVPQVNGRPYHEKPPLLFWAIAGISKYMGDVTSFSARMPSVLAALATVLFTFLLAHRLYGETAACWSAIVLISSARFWWQARTVQTDMLLTACLALSLWSFWNWHSGRRIGWLLLFYLGIAAALFTKGPPALVFPLLLAFAFYWGRRTDRRALHLVWGFALAIAAVAAWWIPARFAASSAGGEAAAQTLVGSDLFRQIIGRAVLGISKAQWPWYYFETLPADWLPWALFLPWTLIWVWRNRRADEGMRLLLSWTIPAFVFFSICVGKRAIYLLPLSPAIAILIARSLLELMRRERSVLRGVIAFAWGLLLCVLGAAPFALRYTEYREAWSISLALFGIMTFALAAYALLNIFGENKRLLHAMMAGAFALITLFTSSILLPAANPYLSAREFCAPLRAMSDRNEPYRLYSLCFSREEYVFYSRHTHEPVLTGLLPIATAEKTDLVELARSQKHLREAIAEAAMTVPLESIEHISENEIAALQAAVEAAVQAEDVENHVALQIEEAIRSVVSEFAARFSEDTTAFLFVQEEDWRWLVALEPALARNRVMNRAQIGHRTVLLVANDSTHKPAAPAQPTSPLPVERSPEKTKPNQFVSGPALLAGAGEAAGSGERVAALRRS